MQSRNIELQPELGKDEIQDMDPRVSEELKAGEIEDYGGQVLGIYMFRGEKLCCRLFRPNSLGIQGCYFDEIKTKKLQLRNLSQKDSRFH